MDEKTTDDVWTTPGGEAHPAPLGGVTGGVTGGVAGERAGAPFAAAATTEVLSAGLGDDDSPADAPNRKKLLIWAAVVPLGLALVAALGVGGFYLWSQSQWFVVERADGLAVQHGVGPFADHLPATAEVDLDLLPQAERSDLAEAIPVDGETGAATTITGLRDLAEKCRGTLEAPCPVRALHAPVVEIEPDYFPHGNRLRVSWSELDERGGVQVSIQVNGKKPGGSCPAQLTGAGDCSFTGKFGTQYTVTATTSGPEGTKAVVTDASAFTFAKPAVKVTKGKKKIRGKTTDTGQRGTFCKAILTVTGLKPLTNYGVTVTTSGHAPTKNEYRTDAEGAFSGWVYSYGDPNRGSWLRAKTAGLTSKKVPWQCGGLH